MQQNASHKEEFQIERIAFFSDAVFAIAITLLIIDVKIPELHIEHITDADLGKHLWPVIPKFMGFTISFFVIGLYWVSHHRLFRYIIHYSSKLIWANLLFLFPIAIMPFSTALLSEYFLGGLRIPIIIYTINICASGWLSYRLWRIVSDPANKFTGPLNQAVMQYNKNRALLVPAIFVCTSLVSFISVIAAYMMLPFAGVATSILRKRFVSKHPDLKGDV